MTSESVHSLLPRVFFRGCSVQSADLKKNKEEFTALIAMLPQRLEAIQPYVARARELQPTSPQASHDLRVMAVTLGLSLGKGDRASSKYLQVCVLQPSLCFGPP